ncbi:MAG: prolipoprotein diacylglyceryl transferase [Patescibacteria group bacterium]
MFGWLTHAPPNPILLTLGAVQLHWYGVSLALGLLAGVFLAQHVGKRIGLTREQVVDLTLIMVVSALVGARLLHVLNEWTYYQGHLIEILQIWKGGIAFHGALLGGALAVWGYCRQHKRNIFQLADVLLPALALGQIIGRWGNWFNQELYGRPTGLPWAIPIDPAHRLLGFEAFTRFHPLFLYEMLGNAIILVFLLLLWKRKKLHIGDVAAAYLVLSPGVRLGLDFLRLGEPMIGPFTNAQLFSFILILVGVALVFTRQRRPLY